MPSPRLWALALALALAPAASAQADADTVRALGPVTVGARVEARPGVARIPVAGVLTRDPVAVADVARLVPSAAAPTNSRGEALLTVRGAGERQTAVLLDGAPLAVPWDRRLDLSRIPAGVVGSVDVVRGPASLVWGPNAAGGALDLVPRSLPAAGAITEAEASGGLPARGRLAAVALRASDRGSVTVAVDMGARAGDALAADLPFSQSGRLRTNTDRRSAAALVRLTTGGLAVTALHLEAAGGVAPEGHLDPTRERVRFWRLPEARQTALVARLRRGPLDATAWGALAGQTIRPFADARYAEPGVEQVDRDRSAGARAVVSAEAAGWTLRALSTGLVAEHTRTEADASDRFLSAEGRVGAEAETAAGPVRALLGVGLDASAPLATAGRASSGAFASPALTARLAAPVGVAEVHAGVARAARFPTMRELFGEALGRFVLNPDLRPETTWQAEVGAASVGPDAEGAVTVFARRTTDAIEQEVLPDGRRRRVNLGGSRAVGVEASGTLRRGLLRVDASGTLLHLRGTTAAGPVRLPERPGVLARVAASVLPPTGWTWAVEALATGPALSLGPDGPLDLPASVVLGARVGHRWAVGRGLVGVFARLDNATDAAVFPQAGLPAPGRELRVGLRWVR